MPNPRSRPRGIIQGDFNEPSATAEVMIVDDSEVRETGVLDADGRPILRRVRWPVGFDLGRRP